VDLDGGARERVDGSPGGARSLAVLVFREGQTATDDELRDFLAPDFAKWWLPDRFEAVDEIPKTAVGKFRKTALRERFS
jgi:fatty-acyl-CoA synthase